MTIGVDLGGSTIRAGIEQDGTITQLSRVALENKASLSATLSQLLELIRPYAKLPVKGIGVGVPSVVDIEKGIVYNVVNIPSWERVELRNILEEEFGLPVFINNDVNCFTLGEHRYGLARTYSSVVGMAIGTGLGSGLITNNRLYMGHNCGAGEIGMLPYLDRNLEYYVCSHFFEKKHGLTAYDAQRAALRGNTRALKIWEEFGMHLGYAIKAVIYAYDPEVIVLGGSIAKGYDFFKDTMLHSLDDFAFPQSVRRLKIMRSEDDCIALLGAAALVDQAL
ncbi:ROK family protein [Telluribacter sp. SYSU D00476]|uniref:ROK family protein n=1 Tax=Telluribacter sp. SYSU D00476 TaxID=2811430 RepID=UPI001FF5F02A|nr:ROK family protein [Telluribacter sp. SYSU D00476]